MRLDSFNLKDIRIDPQRGFENLLDLRRMNIGLRELSGAFHVPKDWVLLERTILLLYGCCSLLDPELNPSPSSSRTCKISSSATATSRPSRWRPSATRRWAR